MRFLAAVCAVFVGGAIGIAIGYSTSYMPVSATPSLASVSVYEDRTIPTPRTVQMRGTVVSTDIADGTITFDAQDPYSLSDTMRLTVHTTDRTKFRQITGIQAVNAKALLFAKENTANIRDVNVGRFVLIAITRTPGDLEASFVLLHEPV